MNFTLDMIEKIVSSLVAAVPVKGVKIGLGDFNNNGKPDVSLEVVLEKGSPIVLGPIDAPIDSVVAFVKGVAGSVGVSLGG